MVLTNCKILCWSKCQHNSFDFNSFDFQLFYYFTLFDRRYLFFILIFSFIYPNFFFFPSFSFSLPMILKNPDDEWPAFFHMPVLMLMLITVLNDGTLIAIGFVPLRYFLQFFCLTVLLFIFYFYSNRIFNFILAKETWQ